jgi:hypothetical protein
VRKFLILAIALLGVAFGVFTVLFIRHPPTQPSPGLVAVFPFETPNGPRRADLAQQLADRLTTPKAKVIVAEPAEDAQAAAERLGVRLYVVGLAGNKLHARLFDVTASAGPRAEATGRDVDELAAQLRGGILGAAVRER